jgi:small-conductance mechanosensitive channel
MLWLRFVIAGAAILLDVLLAKLVDRALSRRELAPEAATRYRTVRHVVITAIVFVGVLSALLVIPQVRRSRAGSSRSSAVIGLVIGSLAADDRQRRRRVLIAFSQPLRLGDWVVFGDAEGTVEEIGLTYTFIRAPDNSRLVIPNEKLASDTIRNLTIRSTEKVAEVTVPVPLEQDLDALLDALRTETSGDVFVSALDDNAVITLREPAASQAEAERLARELRLRAHRRLRAAGVYG